MRVFVEEVIMIQCDADISTVIAELQSDLIEHANVGQEYLMFRDVLIASRQLDEQLQQRVSKTKELTGIISFHGLEPFIWFQDSTPVLRIGPCTRRIWFSPVKNATWPTGRHPEKSRSDVQRILNDTPTIQSSADVATLIALLVHNWHLRAQKEEPFFYFQDVTFATLADWISFSLAMRSHFSLHLCLSYAPFCSAFPSTVRIYIYPWQFVHSPVERQCALTFPTN